MTVISNLPDPTVAPPQYGQIQHALPEVPRQVRIETSSFCNAGCAFCHAHGDFLPMQRKKAKMTPRLFSAILDDIASWPQPLEEMVPTVWGETFLNRYWYEMLLEVSHKLPRTGIQIVTTGTLMTEAVIEKLALVPTLKGINFSINAFFADTWTRTLKLPPKAMLTAVNAVHAFHDRRPDVVVNVSMVHVPEQMTEMEKDIFKEYWSKFCSVTVSTVSYAGNPDRIPDPPVTLSCRSVVDGLVILDSGLVGTGCCLLPGEEVMTTNGLEAIETINIGHKVLTHQGRWREVMATKSHHYRGQAVHLFVRYSAPIRVTSEHPILTPDGWRPADQITDRDLVVIPVPSESNTDVLDLAETKVPVAQVQHRGRLGMLTKWENHILVGGDTLSTRARPQTSVKRLIHLTPEVMFVLGLFVAEGYTTQNEAGHLPNKLAFSFGRHEGSLADRVAAILEDTFGATPCYYTRRTTLSVHVSSPILARIFREWFGTGAKNKRIPPWILQLSNTLLWHFVQGYLAGDGHYRPQDGWSGATVSRTLAQQLRLCAAALGSRCRVWPKKSYESWVIEGRIVNVSPVWQWGMGHTVDIPPLDGLRPSAIFESVVRVSREPFEGTVYNLEVEDDHSFTDGIVAVHNCFWSGDAQELAIGHFPEETLLDIWRGEKLKKIVGLHNSGRRAELDLCKGCSFA